VCRVGAGQCIGLVMARVGAGQSVRVSAGQDIECVLTRI
jgi:hypothetical protein